MQNTPCEPNINAMLKTFITPSNEFATFILQHLFCREFYVLDNLEIICQTITSLMNGNWHRDYQINEHRDGKIRSYSPKI